MEYERTYAKIDLDAIEKNVAGVRARIPETTGIMAVIKANAYGHGAVDLATFLSDKVERFGVATLDEALELRRAGVQKDILVLGCLNEAELSRAISADVTLTVADFASAEKINAAAKELGAKAKVHIKLDTGMSRIGFQPTEKSVEEVVKTAQMENVFVEGMFTHFAIADAKDKSSANAQKEKYDAFRKSLEAAGVVISVCHVNNSAATMELSDHYDMVRMGIMLYGLYPSDEMDRSYPLYPAMELVTHISFIKDMPAGRGISYGHTFVTDRPMRVATIPCGYADGYPRCLSGDTSVIIAGKRCAVLGRICMDQMLVDVTDVPCAKVGDEVVLVGRIDEEYIPVEELADKAHSFNYEFVCGIARRVPRVYFEKGKYKKTTKYV